MKKVLSMILCVLSISILLLGCSKEQENEVDLKSLKKIEMVSSENPELVVSTIESNDEIDDFVNNLIIEEWNKEPLPTGAIENNIYNIYQEETDKLFEINSKKKKLKHLATITTYEDSPYINLKTLKLSFSFKVPQEVAEYLSNYQ